jgi:hypothetical protein
MTARTTTRPADAWGSLYGTTRRGRFVRERLPEPLAYYAEAAVVLRGRGAWRDALCPFHQDSRPSLRVNVETGAFRCMACGAAGGDVLAFHRRRHGMTFIEAARALGAWEAGR